MYACANEPVLIMQLLTLARCMQHETVDNNGINQLYKCACLACSSIGQSSQFFTVKLTDGVALIGTISTVDLYRWSASRLSLAM